MLSRSILTLLIPVPLILFGLCAAFFIEYQKHQVGVAAFGGEKLSPVQYVKLRIENYRLTSGARAAVAEFNFRDSLPAAPEGWAQERYDTSHGVAITGTLFEPSAVVKDTEKSIQDAFTAVRKHQKDAATASYIKDDQIVSIKIKAVPMIDGTTLEGKLAKAISQTVIADPNQEPDPVFAVAGGIEFKQLPQVSTHIASRETRPVSYRRFEGTLGTHLNIFVFSNADDKAIFDVIQGVDYAALKDFANITQVIAAQADPSLGIQATPEQVRAAIAQTDDLPDTPAETTAPAPQAAEVAQASTAQAAVTAVTKVSFRDRLKSLLGGGESAQDADKPRKMVCSRDQGFKRCVAVDE